MNIDELRAEIDGIDDSLLELFHLRMAAAKKIGRYKKENDLPIKDREREREIINRLCEKSKPELAEYVKSLFTALFEMSSNYQRN